MLINKNKIKLRHGLVDCDKAYNGTRTEGIKQAKDNVQREQTSQLQYAFTKGCSKPLFICFDYGQLNNRNST